MPHLTFRRARKADVAIIVRLLADDKLGSQRETAEVHTLAQYHAAFDEVEADPNQLLIVVEDREEVIGTLQLSFIPGLSRRATKRGQIEAVRIARHRRGEKIGEEMIRWAVEQCAMRQCSLVQLTSDRVRRDARRFYEKLGFEPSHIGYKLTV